MSQSLELSQRHHVMHLLPEMDCGPNPWTVLKELHAPTSVVATLMLEKELSALRLSEGEPVQPVLDKMRDLYANGKPVVLHSRERMASRWCCTKFSSFLISRPTSSPSVSLPRLGSKKPLELVHMDLVGPLPVQGHKGERYFLTIEDDWSRLMWAYPLKQKDHAASTIKEDWLPFVEKQAECVGKRIRTDRGERANRTILETARALLIESGVGNSMWPHAVRHATVARNRVLTKVGNESWVPLERWLGRKPLVDMVRVFGCMAVAHVPKKYRSKLGASAIWCVHLGLAAESKGWLLWEPSKAVLFDGRDVKFVEGMMYGSWKKQPETMVSQQMEHITMQLDLTPSNRNTSGAAGPEDEQQQGKARAPTLPQRRKPKVLTVRADVAEQQLGNEESLLILPHGYDPDEEDEPAYCFLAPAPEEPASMEEALAGPDREKWLVSRDAECQSLLENGTWDLVVLPKGKKAVQCKWVLRIKTDDKGQVTIYKSRLVAKGFMQKEKQDFDERFAPSAKPPTLRVLLANAAVSGKFIIQMDISTAFLNGILEQDVYMTQPPGYEDGMGRVCKLKKSIYGLKQAPRCWYQKLAAVLEEMGFRTSSCDESLFLKGEGEKLVLILVYVDDILLFSSSMKEIQKVLQQLMKNFKCKTLGEVKYYLGMHVERDLYHRWLKLHQEKFIKELGEKYGIETESKVAVGCKFTVHNILPSVCTSMHVQMHLGVNGMFVCFFAFEIFA
ncbi:unnamed protein product [Closterium sp. NIES-54]